MEKKQLRFSDGDISRLTQLLEGCEGVRVRCRREMSGIWPVSYTHLDVYKRQCDVVHRPHLITPYLVALLIVGG